jgi:hypothetical protein
MDSKWQPSVGGRHLGFLVGAAIAAAIALANPGRAEAGEYTINACQADADNFASSAFEDFATRGMRWRRACDPLGPGLRGLVTANVVRSGHIAQGAQSSFVLAAPPGTSFSRLRWSGHAQRRDCRYALQLFAERADGSDATIKNVRANHGCPHSELAQASSWPKPRAFDLGGATRIVQRVVCVGASSAEFCSGRGLNYMQTFTAEATVVDTSSPAVTVLADGPLARGEWVGGMQSVGYEASDNVGVRRAQAWLGGPSLANEARPCDYAQRVPCQNGTGRLQLDTRQVPEGSEPLHVSAEDAAGNSADSSQVTAHIDNAAPGTVPVAVEGGEGWRNRNAYAVGWANAPEPDRAPIVAAHYRLCRVGSGDCVADSRAGTALAGVSGLAVPAPGEWEFRLWREDAAGNQQPDNASVPVRFRFDPEPPQLGFENPSAADPTRVSVQVTDPISGLGGGGIEISRVGSGIWQSLGTTDENSHLIAHIDDAALPPGDYELRATAYDQAQNLASTAQTLDGRPMKLKLPLRVASSLRAGVVTTQKVWRTVRHGGKPHKVRHTVKRLVPRATFAFGQHVTLAGVVTDRDGRALGGVAVQVYSRKGEADESLVGTTTTGTEGRFKYPIDARASEAFRFVYGGTATRLPVDGGATVLVPGSSTFDVTRSRILNGQSVVFSGRVRGRPLPERGKLVELQVWLTDEWSTFRTIRTKGDGRWRLPYRFERTCGIQVYGFRARLPGEAVYPLESGHSRRLNVRVKGRQCSTG